MQNETDKRIILHKNIEKNNRKNIEIADAEKVQSDDKLKEIDTNIK